MKRTLKITSIILSLVLLAISFSGCTVDDNRINAIINDIVGSKIYESGVNNTNFKLPTEFKEGNSCGNLRNNGGIAAIQDDWIYYVTDDGINKINTDGSNHQLIYEHTNSKYYTQYLSVYGEWLYFYLGNISDYNGKYVKIKTDGSMGKSFYVLYEGVYNFQVVNGYFYYTDPEDDTLHRANLDKTNDVILLQHEYVGYNLQITEDKIYFGNNIDVCQVDLDGKNLKHYKDAGSQEMIIYKGKKYSSGGLACENIDGTNRVELLKRSGMNPVIQDDWIYFTFSEEESVKSQNNLYKIKIDGTEMQKLNDCETMNFAVVGDWIYYQSAQVFYHSDNHATYYADGLYRVRIDGTQNTKIEEIQDLEKSKSF